MKKILFLIVALFSVFTISACEDLVEDGANALLQEALDSLNGVIGDPSNVTTTFQVPVSLINGVTAVWESSNPGVIAFEAPVSGLSRAVVNRPAFGDPDAVVTLTAVLVIESELDALQFLSDEFVIQVTVKASTVEVLVIEDVADILAIRDVAYDRTIEVTISDLTIIGLGNDGVFAYDGTGTLQLYGSNLASVELGKVYTVTGTPDWYFGLWELVNWTAVEQVGATPQYPTQTVITDVEAYIADLVEDDQDSFASQTAAAGSFEPVYAKVTGLVYIIPGDTGNYNTYLLNSDFLVGTDTFATGTTGVPAKGLMAYYNTKNFADLRLYDGIPVTIDVIIHTYRSNNNAFAFYYVGGDDGIEATLSDAQKLSIDAAAVTLPLSSITTTTLNLPTAGANGATIAWSFTDAQSANNTYLDLTTGVATAPEGSQVSIGLTATITVAGLEPVVKTFTFKLGLYPVSTIAEARAFVSGATARVVGVLTATTDDASNGAFFLQDATGGISLFDPTNVLTVDMLGKTYEVIAAVGAFRGLIQLRVNTLDDLVELTGSEALVAPNAVDISALTLNSETLLPLQGQLVDLNGFVLKTALNPSYTSSFSINLINETGQEIVLRLDNAVPGFGEFVLQVAGSAAGTAFDFDGLVLGWFDNPQLLVASTSVITSGTVYTDQQLLNAANAVYRFPVVADAEITGNLSLGTPLFGATVTLTSSNEAVIGTDGTVVRPANGAGNATVTLGYTLTLNAVSTVEVAVSVVVLEAAAVQSGATTVVAKYETAATTNMTDGNNAASIGLDATLFNVLSIERDPNPLHIGLNSAGNIRLYGASSTNGNTLTISIGSGFVITKIEIEFGGSGAAATGTIQIGSDAATSISSVLNTTETLESLSATSFSIKNTSPSTQQVFILSITITYEAVPVA